VNSENNQDLSSNLERGRQLQRLDVLDSKNCFCVDLKGTEVKRYLGPFSEVFGTED